MAEEGIVEELLPKSPKTEDSYLGRKERYLANLANLEEIEPSDFYPPEIRYGEWPEVNDPEELNKFVSLLPAKYKDDKGIPILMGVHKNSETGYIFAVPTFGKYNKPSQIMLDMLGAVKDMYPWSRLTGIVIDESEEFFTVKNTVWHPYAGMVEMSPYLVEGYVNGLGDSKYANSAKRNFLIVDTASIAHEATHIENGGLVSGSINECAPTTVEYLAFPGRNPKTEDIANNALQMISDKKGEYDEVYDKALARGILILATHKFGDTTDSLTDLEHLARRWKSFVDGLAPGELAQYRNDVIPKLLLSDADEKVVYESQQLRQKYPRSMKQLGF